MSGRSRRPYLAVACATLLAGLAWRLAPLGLPPFLFKYGGSVLWAAMIYWLTALLSPRARVLRLALGSAAVACAVEWFKLVQTPALDRFRSTLAGKLLLGRYFSVRDMFAYLVAIALAAVADRWLVRRTAA